MSLPATSADAARRPRRGGKLRLAAPEPGPPAEAWRRSEVTAAALVHDTLYRLDASGGPRPHLTRALPRLGPSGKTATITIEPGLAFHDGSRLDARGVVASLVQLRQAGRTPHAWLLANVLAIKADGPNVIFHLRLPVPDLATRLAAPPMAIVRQSKAGGVSGCGPFAPSREDRVLKPFSLHRNGPPFLAKVQIQDLTDAREERLRFQLDRLDVSRPRPTSPAIEIRRVDGTWQEGVVLVVRRAELGPRIAGAVKKDTLALFSRVPARPLRRGVAPPAQTGPWPGDPLRLLVRDAPHLRSMAEALLLALTPAGARVTVVPLPQAEFVAALLAGKGDLVLFERPPVVASRALIAEQLRFLARGGTAYPLLQVAPRLHLRPGWHGVAFDPAGYPRYEGAWSDGRKR